MLMIPSNQPFLYATNKMSMNRHALVHKVIPYMDILTEHLARFKDDTVLSAVVRSAAERGMEVINRYYSKTDQSVIYRIAMSKWSILCSGLWELALIYDVIGSPPSRVQDAVLH